MRIFLFVKVKNIQLDGFRMVRVNFERSLRRFYRTDRI